MTRSTRGDQIVVKPKNDVYTGLAVTACVVLILGLVYFFTQSTEKFGDSLFAPSGQTPAAQR